MKSTFFHITQAVRREQFLPYEKKKWLQVSNIFGRSEKTELQHGISYFLYYFKTGTNISKY